jgi:hypothetical protein
MYRRSMRDEGNRGKEVREVGYLCRIQLIESGEKEETMRRDCPGPIVSEAHWGRGWRRVNSQQ